MTESNFIGSSTLAWAWDATSISAFVRCPRYYYYKIVEGWTDDTPTHLQFGIFVHTAFQEYEKFRVNHSHDESLRHMLRLLLPAVAAWTPLPPRSKSEELKTPENLIRLVIWYLEHYSADALSTYLLHDGSAAVELNFNFQTEFSLAKTPVHLCGYLDRIVVFNNDKFVDDYKTTTTTPSSYYFDRYDLDNQMCLYNLGAQILLATPIRGVIVDAIQLAVGFIRPVRSITYRTPDQLEEWLENTQVWLAQAEAYASASSPSDPSRAYPMNLASCGNYGGCEFAKVCSKSRQIRSKVLASDFTKGPQWNPLIPR